jgi:ATP-dependent helicase Lhr and Lhr-like helicase
MSFHPAITHWFRNSLGEPTAAQRRGWASIGERQHTLIAAPTGSGKTLAAFLTALDDLLCEGLRGPLPDEVRVVYVSPLKALSADIHKNLAEPRRGIRRAAQALGLEAPRITVAVRTGDTPHADRVAMLRRPPHILVTTPESLYLLLTAGRSRDMLRTVRTVIVDEIHAVIGTRRGAHLALSLERLQRVASAPLLRIGLSATQKPIAEVARYLTGAAVGDSASASTPIPCAIADEGHRRAMDLGIELPRSELEAVMSHDVWAEQYARLTELIQQHQTTLIFVNTRRMAERVARQLSETLGEDAVTAHHGSLSKETRLDAESRLKNGTLQALVATSSLELGIDIGHVDLVCQIGSPRRIATFIQRVGRSGHTVSGLPKGRLFPVSRDDLIECAALLGAVGRGDLDALKAHDAPLDVLAQQVVAETASEEYGEDELFHLVRRAWPYRALERTDFDAVVGMLSDGFATTRGRRGALVHRDEINGRLRARRGARSLAITSGGAIPEVADYRVVVDPEETFVGTLNEDFAIESTAGDIFQLGNTAWRILQVASGVVRVADAKGAPPTLPFWLGEAPGRSDELSEAVSALRGAVHERLAGTTASEGDAAEWLARETGMSREAADQAVAYLAEGGRVLGVLPTQDTLVLERFFDESGGMQLVLHAPFGSRVNRAWGLALRKRFCRQFNFELQAAATEDGLLLSLGPQHSFPLADVFRYLHPATVRDVLVQALLDAPVFQTRWRWNTTISLAVPRNRHGKKVAPPLQRMRADDLMAAVFPDAAACLENIPGDREIPDHPLVKQTVYDCLHEAMDCGSLSRILDRIHRGEVTCVAVDTVAPSVLCHEILNARPYAFLDDAPLEERRAQAVHTRRAGTPAAEGNLGALDESAIERVCNEERPDPRDADELHDVLLSTGFLTQTEAARIPADLFADLLSARRATTVVFPVAHATPPPGGRANTVLWAAAERLPELAAACPQLSVTGGVVPPPTRAREWAREDALVELLRGRLALVGPTRADALAEPLGLTSEDVDPALRRLESEGVILRGQFRHRMPHSPGRRSHSAPGTRDSGAGTSHAAPRTPDVEWCDRRLLARIHRYTLTRLRAEIEPVSPADFMRFLFDWQHATGRSRLTGAEGLLHVIGQLDGYELAADAWERAVLPARLDRYESAMLDMLCLTGQVGWARLSSAAGPTRLVRATPVALFVRAHARAWSGMASDADGFAPLSVLSVEARALLDALRSRGASFTHELASFCERPPDVVRQGLAELVSLGLVASDGFAGLRGLIANRDSVPRESQTAGRWAALVRDESSDATARDMEVRARALLGRYGVICRRLLERESRGHLWRTLVQVYRRLEARGEIRGGRFVAGLSGEQFALPEAVERLREIRRTPPDHALAVISAADPLNLAGIVTAGARVSATASTRLVYRNGVPLAALEGDYIRPLATFEPAAAADVASALAGRRVPPIVSGFIGRVS